MCLFFRQSAWGQTAQLYASVRVCVCVCVCACVYVCAILPKSISTRTTGNTGADPSSKSRLPDPWKKFFISLEKPRNLPKTGVLVKGREKNSIGF